MKSAFNLRSWMLFVLLLLLSGSVFAQSTGVLYPGWGTTLNGKPVYFSVLVTPGYQVDTAAVGSTINFHGAELDLSPNSTLVIGDPLVLSCGTIVVREGSAEISDGKTTSTFALGEKAHPVSSCDSDNLPDAPSAKRSDNQPFATRRFRDKSGAVPAAAGGPFFDLEVTNWSYWALNAAMLSSSLVTVDLTHKCLEAGACTSLPDAFHRRRVMYGVGLPTVAGVSYLSYYLKRKHYRLWFVPAAVVIVGNIVVSTHAAHYSH